MVEQLLRSVAARFEKDSGLKVDCLVDFHVPFPGETDLALEVAVVGRKNTAFVRFKEDGTYLGWGWILPSGRRASES
jgi:hypothetical protein